MIAVCEQCRGTLSDDAEVCLVCGTWRASDAPGCESHRAVPAIALCVVCGRPMCGECADASAPRAVCDDQLHREIASTHVLLEAPLSEFEADWIVINLRQAGIDARQFSANEYLAVNFRPVAVPARVLVPAESVTAARAVLARFADMTAVEIPS